MNKTLATEEDIKLIRAILAELSRQTKVDLSVFNYDIREYNIEDLSSNFSDDVPECNRVTIKWLTLNFQPGTNPNHGHKDIDRVSVAMCPHSGEFTVDLMYNRPASNGQKRAFTEQYEQQFVLGNNKELNGLYAKTKMDFIRLYKTVREYQDDYLPRKRREQFETAVYETFPGLLDAFLMEDENESKES